MSHSEHTIIIGVDGGGSGCRAAIGTAVDGVMAQAQGGRANFASDPDLALRNVISAIASAATQAGFSQKDLSNAQAHVGLAGVMTPADANRVSTALPYSAVTATDDRPTALNGALGGEDGFLLSVGTGTIAAASANGVFRSVGGWGFHVADQASGAWIGRLGLERALLCHDGLETHSDLTRKIMAEFQDDPNKIVSFSLTAKPGDYGAMAPLVVDHARKGDAVGRAIMTKGADHLAQCLAALGFNPGDRICLTGGVGPHYATYLPTEALTGEISCQGSAVEGAFNLAKSTLQSTKAEMKL